MLSMTPLGSFSVHIAYVAVAVITEFTICNRPEYDSRDEQDVSFLSILSISGA